MTIPRHERAGIDCAALLQGFLIGLPAGALAATLRTLRWDVTANQRQRENPRRPHKPSAPSDPVTKEIAEGKAAARRRRAELGLDA